MEEIQKELPVIARFEVRRRAYLAPDGTILRDLPDFATDHNLVVAIYRGMALARAFDLKAVSLQRTGRLGTYATSLGQEAVAVGIASAMRPEAAAGPDQSMIFHFAFRSVRRHHTQPASPTPSNTANKPASQSAFLATARPRRATCGKR